MTETTSIKRTTRRKTSAVTSLTSSSPTLDISSMKHLSSLGSMFSDLSDKIELAQEEFESLQKEVTQTKELWEKEKKDHEAKIIERDQHEEITRKRDEETYRYEIQLAHKKEEDEFREKKAAWERELEGKKEEIAKEKEELTLLRKQAASFPEEKENAIKEASVRLEKELTSSYAIEKKLRDQEVASVKEVLALKIESLTKDNARQEKEIETLKKTLDEATREVKDIAVKVIEARGSTGTEPQTSPRQE